MSETRRGHVADAGTWGGPDASTQIKGATSMVSLSDSVAEAAPLRVGSSIGRFVVLEEVGRGGMGRVVRAYDPKLQREVAIKEVHGEILRGQGADRLVAEARAMAKLSHPNVVAVYDVEALDDERVVLVMEYVPGTTLKAWLTERPRDAGVVVERFVAAGRGLAAAHAVGLLHRDFKPSNVLVGEGGQVKVGDFGLAKLDPSRGGSRGVSDHLSDRGDLTHEGTVLGTPLYMAPEQHRGEPLTAAADQYAFCVALWEALIGEPPFHVAPLVLAKQKGPPPWPGGEVVPRRLTDAIRRGLAPAPEDRWPGIEELLAVLSARTTQRWTVWMIGASAVGLVAAAFALGRPGPETRCTGAEQQLVGVWDDARREEVHDGVLRVKAPYAARVWQRTAAELDGYAQEWIDHHTEACKAATIRGEQSPEVMDLRMSCLHGAKLELSAAVDLLARADATTVANAHTIVGRLPPLPRCADVSALRSDVPGPPPAEADAVEAIRVLLAEATVADDAGRYDIALEKSEEALRELNGIEYRPIHAEVYLEYGSALDRTGEPEAAEAKLREALGIAIAARQWRVVRDAASALMPVVGGKLQRMDEGLRYRELALGLAEGDAHAEAVAHGNLALVLHAQGEFSEALVEAERALELAIEEHGPDHHTVAGFRVNLAAILQSLGKHAESERELRSVLAALETELGPDHVLTASAHYGLGLALERQKRFTEAEAEFRRAATLQIAGYGPEHPSVASSCMSIGNVLRAQGKLDEAEVQLRRALEILRALGPERRDVLVVETNLGATLLAQKRTSEAVQLLRDVAERWEKAFGPDHPDVARAWMQLGNALYEQGDLGGTEAEFRRALAIMEPALGPDHPDVALARTSVAKVLLATGRPHDALSLAEMAWEVRKRPGVPVENRAHTAFTLARAMWATNASAEQRDRARVLARDAAEWFRNAGPTSAGSAEEVEQWLEARAAP